MSHTKKHWENFWGGKTDIQQTYSNFGRIGRNLLQFTGLQEKIVVELGAGTGRDILTMPHEGAILIPIDYSFHSLKLLKANEISQTIMFEPLGADAFRLPLKDNSVDILFHQGLLEHFQEEEGLKLLEENIRVLKSNGILLVDVPQRFHYYTIIKHLLIFFNKWFAGWEREFSIGELKAYYSRFGLHILATYGEWMYPSLFYRILREVLQRLKINLPLIPIRLPVLHKIRMYVRKLLTGTALQKHTALSIGIIGRKM